MIVYYSIPALLAALCYMNGQHGDFVHDDVMAISHNRDVTGQSDVMEVFYHDFWGQPMWDPVSHKSYRPLCVLSFRFDYSLSGGSSTWFHRVNILLHVLVTCLVTHVSISVLQAPAVTSTLAASLFAVHPIHTEAVTGLVGRADVMAAILFLLSFCLYSRCVTTEPCQETAETDQHRDVNDNITPCPGYARATHVWAMLTAMLLAVAAMLCKETGITVLGVAFCYDAIVTRNDIRRDFMQRTLSLNSVGCVKRCVVITITVVTALLVRGLAMNFQQPTFKQEDNPAAFATSFLTRSLTFNYLSYFNAWLLLNPSLLSYDWSGTSIPLIESWADHRNAYTLAFYVTSLLVCCACLMAMSGQENKDSTRTKARLLPFVAVMMMVLPYIPASNLFFTVGFVVAERILYIPSIGFCLLVAHGHQVLSSRFPKVKVALMVSFVCLLVVMATRTIHRNKVWDSRSSLFRSGVKDLPENGKVHYNLANLLRDEGDIKMAEVHYRLAIKYNPNHASYHLNLGAVLANSTESKICYLEALRLKPNHKGAMVNLGGLMLEEGNLAGLNLVERALDLDPNYLEGLLTLGKYHLLQEDYHPAEGYITQALSNQPDSIDGHYYHGLYLHRKGDLDKALLEYTYVLTNKPKNVLAMQSMAKLCIQLGNFSEAVNLLNKAIQLQRNCSECFSLLGSVYSKTGQGKDAVLTYKLATQMSPNNTKVQLKYIQSLKENNQSQQAWTHLISLIDKVPNDLTVVWFAFNFSMEQRRLDSAAQFIQGALEIAEKTEDKALKQLYKDQAEIFRLKQDYDNALKFYEKSLEKDPDYVEARNGAGALYHIKGNYKKAEEYYLQVLKFEPNNKLAKVNLQKLRSLYR